MDTEVILTSVSKGELCCAPGSDNINCAGSFKNCESRDYCPVTLDNTICESDCQCPATNNQCIESRDICNVTGDDCVESRDFCINDK